jgi:hypothetical protein
MFPFNDTDKTDAHAKNCMTPLEEIKIGPSDQSSL